jgi:hypothetical protein
VHYGEDFRQWLKATYAGKVEWTSKPDYVAFSVAGSNSNGFFPVGKEVYAVPSWTIEDLVARLQTAVTTVDANMLLRVRENT